MTSFNTASNARLMHLVARPARRQVLYGGLLAAWLAGAAAANEGQVDEAVGLILYGHGQEQAISAPRLKTDVRVDVSGIIARVQVVQGFTNPTDAWVEGVYGFPLPENAAVDRLNMRIGDRRVAGEIQERQRAERTYANAKVSGRVASLVSQQRPNLFTTRAANIPPGGNVEVEIQYQQTIEWRDAEFSLRFPMVVAPRYVPGVPLVGSPNGQSGLGWALDTDQVPDASEVTPPVALQPPADFQPLKMAIHLNAGLPLASVESLFHDVEVETLAPGRYRIQFADGAVAAERDFVLRWRPTAATQPRVAVFRESWNDRHYALLMVMPPIGDSRPPRVARELILVVDTSGSMHGESIAQARAGVLQALDRLGPQDRFNVIRFNDRAHGLFDRARAATGANIALARRFVAALEAEGGTEMRPALSRALDDPAPSGLLRQIVFVTDGAVANEQALFGLIEQRLGDARLYTIGIGSAPNTHFMRRAARFGRGTFTYIGSTAEVANEVAALFRRLDQPVVTDLRLRWLVPAGTVLEQATERVPDLHVGEPLVLAVATDLPPSAVEVRGRFGSHEWQYRAGAQHGTDAPGVHVLWARRRIASWLDAGVSGVDPERIREAVLQLALEHQLVSPFTSLVAVDKTPSRPGDAPMLRRAVPTRLPAGWSADAVFGPLPATATPGPMLALAGLLAMLSAVGLWWDGRRR